jgi:hypothetical protein
MVQKGYIQTSRYLDWVQSRMREFKRGFMVEDFLLSPKYREQIIEQKLGEHILATCTGLKSQTCQNIANAGKLLTDMYATFFVEATQLGEVDAYEGLDITNEPTKLELHKNLDILQKTLEDMWISVDKSGKSIPDKINIITHLRTEIPLLDPKSKEFLTKTNELNALMIDDTLLNFNYMLIRFRALTQKIGLSSNFNGSFGLIDRSVILANFTEDRIGKYDLALNKAQQQQVNANSPKRPESSRGRAASLTSTSTLPSTLPSKMTPTSRTSNLG